MWPQWVFPAVVPKDAAQDQPWTPAPITSPKPDVGGDEEQMPEEQMQSLVGVLRALFGDDSVIAAQGGLDSVQPPKLLPDMRQAQSDDRFNDEVDTVRRVQDFDALPTVSSFVDDTEHGLKGTVEFVNILGVADCEQGGMVGWKIQMPRSWARKLVANGLAWACGRCSYVHVQFDDDPRSNLTD